VVIGCAMPEAEQGMNVARIASLLAGLPDSVPAMTINRFCSSGIQSIAIAAQSIALGQADLMLAGGTESMSMVPLGGNKLTVSPSVFANKEHEAIAYSMGITAENVAKKWQISREAQDEFALQSHQKALNATQQGWFDEEITPYTVISKQADLFTGERQVDEKIISKDEGPRRDTNLETLSGLRTVFAARGTVTAGNSSQTSDGAGAVLLASEQAVKAYQLQPIAIWHGFSVAGVAPEYMGIGPVAAIPKVLQQSGLSLQQMDWIELNEAFAAQSLAVIKDLSLDPTLVNPQGGAIALGHPLGATGAVRAATIIHGLRRINRKYGMITMCIGTGMGAAAIIEVI